MVKNNAVINIALLLVVLLTEALPQTAGVEKVPTSGYSDNTPSIDLPFLQFKNGGIRVNFAGYHAEAGLGGLLGGSDAQGGLYASAGTPWGPSASAGLGGALGGKDGSAKGGLHARAGWGPNGGGPEASAGLGGSLDGSGRYGSRARGRLYAGATAGGPKAAVGLDGSIDKSRGQSGSSYAAASDGRKTKISVKDVSNIQTIKSNVADEKVSLVKSGSAEPTTTLEFKLPASGGKKAVLSSLVAGELENGGTKYDVAEPNGVVDALDAHDIVEVSYPGRRYYRKRLRGSPVRKRAQYKYFTTNTETIADVPTEAASSHHVGGIVTRQAIDDRSDGYGKTTYVGAVKPKGITLFDDIFNIPISTLTAVNQMLNNKSG